MPLPRDTIYCCFTKGPIRAPVTAGMLFTTSIHPSIGGDGCLIAQQAAQITSLSEALSKITKDKLVHLKEKEIEDRSKSTQVRPSDINNETKTLKSETNPMETLIKKNYKHVKKSDRMYERKQ